MIPKLFHCQTEACFKYNITPETQPQQDFAQMKGTLSQVIMLLIFSALIALLITTRATQGHHNSESRKSIPPNPNAVAISASKAPTGTYLDVSDTDWDPLKNFIA